MDDKKKYICKLPTNGYQAGQEAYLTEAEVENFNGGEAEPRFVLAEDQSAPEVADNPADRGAVDEGQTPASDASEPEANAPTE